jgi:hypothetical protein
MPKVGEREPHSKFSRSSIDRLVRPQKSNNFKPPVASRYVRIQGTRRGTRLISLASLLEFIDRQQSENIRDRQPTEGLK